MQRLFLKKRRKEYACASLALESRRGNIHDIVMKKNDTDL